MTKKRFEGVELRESKEVHFAEHEVYMSFNGDSDAEAFHEWWDEEGAVKFQEWLDKRST